MANKLELSVSCGDYEITRPLREGRVELDGIELTVLNQNTISHDRKFNPERNAECDAGEFNVCGYYMARDRGHGYIALPVFPHRRFRHGFVFINATKGITKPEDLRGGKIGCGGGLNAAANVWLRGILNEHYGLSHKDVSWVVDAPHERFLPRGTSLEKQDGFEIEVIGGKPSLEDRLLGGELDAVMSPGYLRGYLNGDERIGRLWPNYPDEEKAYYRKTQIFPIMHALIVKEALLREHPWVAGSLAAAFNESKRIALRHLENPRTLPIAFYTSTMEEQTALLGVDPWQYGMTAQNRKNLATSLRYTYEQGLIANHPDVDSLFHPLGEGVFNRLESG